MTNNSQITVIGCGVSGLSCAIRLLEAWPDRSVTIWTDALPPHTTSDVAAAIWLPYTVQGDPAWGDRTFRLLAELVERGAPGVSLVEGFEFLSTPLQQEPDWVGTVPSFRYLTDQELPPAYRAGLAFQTILVEMDLYLPYLVQRFGELGGQIMRLQEPLRSLDEALAHCDVLVNCSGVYASRLVPDPTVYPLRGQAVRVEPLPIGRFYVNDDGPDPTYVIPRSNDCILGGTATPHDWSPDPDPAITASILERCAALVPEAREAKVIEVRVGFRPARPEVRVEAERRGEKLIVHDYGHGGAGVTLSWGCAERVVELVRQGAE